MSADLLVARQLLSVLEKRINNVKQARPTTTPAQKSHYILMLPTMEHDGSLGDTEPVRVQARTSSDAAFVVQKVLLVSTGEDPAGAVVPARDTPFFDLTDRASGGRTIVTSQRQMLQNNRFPITHFANTLPGQTRAACYSAFTLPSEYLLARGAVVEARLFRESSTECTLRIALAGYKVYG